MRRKTTKVKLPDLEMREAVADHEYDNIPGDEAWAIVYKQLYGDVFTRPISQIKKQYKELQKELR